MVLLWLTESGTAFGSAGVGGGSELYGWAAAAENPGRSKDASNKIVGRGSGFSQKELRSTIKSSFSLLSLRRVVGRGGGRGGEGDGVRHKCDGGSGCWVGGVCVDVALASSRQRWWPAEDLEKNRGEASGGDEYVKTGVRGRVTTVISLGYRAPRRPVVVIVVVLVGCGGFQPPPSCCGVTMERVDAPLSFGRLLGWVGRVLCRRISFASVCRFTTRRDLSMWRSVVVVRGWKVQCLSCSFSYRCRRHSASARSVRGRLLSLLRPCSYSCSILMEEVLCAVDRVVRLRCDAKGLLSLGWTAVRPRLSRRLG